MRECADVAEEVDHSRIGVHNVLKRLEHFMRSDSITLQTAFRSFDKNSSGYLDPLELMQMIRSIMPRTSIREARQLISHLQRFDTNLDGQISLVELRRCVEIVCSEADDAQKFLNVSGTQIGVPASQEIAHISQGQNKKSDPLNQSWKLDLISYAGADYLLDPLTNHVYIQKHEGDWPRCVGKLEEGYLHQRKGANWMLPCLTAHKLEEWYNGAGIDKE